MTSDAIIDQLNKHKRKFNVCENWRHAELFCIGCNKSLGEHDMIYESDEALKYCSECCKKFIKEVPRVINDDTKILEDYGNTVLVRYEKIRDEEIKTCYFSSKGRFIKIKNKRCYI